MQASHDMTDKITDKDITSLAFTTTDAIQFIQTITPIIDEVANIKLNLSKPDPIMALLSNIEAPLDEAAYRRKARLDAIAKLVSNRSVEIGQGILRLPRNIVQSPDSPNHVYIMNQENKIVAVAQMVNRTDNLKLERKRAIYLNLARASTKYDVPAYLVERIPRKGEAERLIRAEKHPQADCDKQIKETTLDLLFAKYTDDPQVYNKGMALFALALIEKGRLPKDITFEGLLGNRF